MTILSFLPLLLSVVIVTNGAPVGGNCMTPLGTIIECRRDVIEIKRGENKDTRVIKQDQWLKTLDQLLNKIKNSFGGIYEKARQNALKDEFSGRIGQPTHQNGGYSQFGGIQEDNSQDLFNSIDKTQDGENEERQFISFMAFLLQKLLIGPQNNQQNHQFGGVGEEQKMNEITDFLDEDSSNYNEKPEESRQWVGAILSAWGVFTTVLDILVGGQS